MGVAVQGRSEVKGSWFVTGQRVLASRPDSVRDAVRAALPPEARGPFDGPLASEWYPEETLQAVLSALYDVVAEGEPERFEELMEETVEHGIHRFFSVVLKLSRPGFVLRQIPTMWKMIRRGPGHVRVEGAPGGSHVRYADFPFFADMHYRVLTRASIRVLLRQAGVRPAEVRVEDWGPSHLTLFARH